MTAHDRVSILIVDDRQENLLAMESLLGEESLEVVTAQSGAEALRLALRRDYALVLLDVQMPGMDGFETAELMRGHPKTKGVPIIFITAGEKSAGSVFKGYEAGAVDYIYKPIDPVILRSKVRVFSELYRQRRAIERHEQLLEQQVAERTRELREALILAEAAGKAKDEFLANTGHEIRTPLTAILGAIDLLSTGDLTAAQRQYFDMISGAADNLLILIDNLLELAEIEAGRFSSGCLRFSLRACLETATASQLGRIREKCLGFRVTIDDTVPDRLCGDRPRLERIVLNLLANAVKFTHRGEIALTVSATPRSDGRLDLHVQVSDTGVGIDRDALARIFKPFEQADGSATRRFGGAGLGLAVCRRLTELMGGEIRVESTAGAGSTFTVTLPVAIDQSSPAAQ
ncbi:MAG: response regulator [Deltaproteobacteria bacterium]|nr:MAG: response regulator [Deltaproteobacteria bacterium]